MSGKECSMKTRVLMSGILSVMMLGTPVLAATTPASSATAHKTPEHSSRIAVLTPAERCLQLEHQFDANSKAYSTSAKYKNARAMRSEGAGLCSSGKQVAGIQKLEQALKAIGETPKS